VLEEVAHAQWVFVIPKMLRPYFLHHRELLGGLARAGWETVLELMATAVDDETFRPGMVAVVQTAGDMANWQPHTHAMVSRGGWTRDWEWVPAPFVDERSAELLFRYKVMRLLQDEGLLRGADRASVVVASYRLFGSQPGVRRARGPAGGRAVGALHYAAAHQPRADDLE